MKRTSIERYELAKSTRVKTEYMEKKRELVKRISVGLKQTELNSPEFKTLNWVLKQIDIVNFEGI